MGNKIKILIKKRKPKKVENMEKARAKRLVFQSFISFNARLCQRKRLFFCVHTNIITVSMSVCDAFTPKPILIKFGTGID